MSAPTLTPRAGGQVLKGWYQGRKPRTIVERVTVTHGASLVALGQQLPPRCRIVWASLNNIAAVVNQGTGDGTNTATGYSLARIGTDTSTNSIAAATASNSTHILLLTTNTASNTSTTNTESGITMPTNIANQYNTSTSPVFLALIPSLASSNRINYGTSGTARFYFGTSTATSASSAGTVDVYLHIEEYQDQVA